jgi:hypothetical protein
MAITAKIENNKLIITADLETPTPSASGKTMVVVSTRGTRKPTQRLTVSPFYSD